MPDAWLPKLEALYSLNPQQMEELRNAIVESADSVELNIQKASTTNRQLAVSFARQFDTLDEETAKKLFDILKNLKEG